MHKFKGDTLIEVALAIGIFSMVAVSVVAVVSGSTSAAQSALELTITREEIDAQAEALRFIQSSYLMGGMSNIAGFSQEKYSKIWQEITRHALDPKEDLTENEFAEAVLNYNPATCDELYNSSNDNNIIKQNAFIINTRNLGIPDDVYENLENGNVEDFINNHIVLSANAKIDNTDVFKTTTTYPRILFSGESDALYDQNSVTHSRNDLFDIDRVEGLFIIAVKDGGSLVVQNQSGNNYIRDIPAYYDFYIRSCWFTPGADRPSTISTVIRLQDPAVMLYNT